MAIDPHAASVLLLEDDWDHRRVFRDYLEHRGWSVREATEAGSARALVAGEGVDLVVLDMGGTDGWALLEELGGRTRRPRLLCLTGDARPESRERALRLGADGYLLKPLPLKQLADTVEALLGPASHAGAPTRPAGEPAPSASAASASPEGPSLVEPARPVVLLLEDDDDARAIYRDMLDFAGFEVMAACDGIEGLRYAEARTPDVIVTDLHMPGMNGVDVARTLRHEGSGQAAIIAVTADSLGPGAAHQREGDRPLFDEVLVKPVSPGALVRAVRAYAPPVQGRGAA